MRFNRKLCVIMLIFLVFTFLQVNVDFDNTTLGQPIVNSTENLAPNPSFEEGENKPIGWIVGYGNENQYLWDTNYSHNGSYSIGLSKFSYYSEPSWMTNSSISIDSSKDYFLSVWYKWSDEPEYTQYGSIGIIFCDENEDFMSGQGQLLKYYDNEWHYHQINYPSSQIPTSSVSVHLYLSHQYSLDFSDVEIRYDDIFFGLAGPPTEPLNFQAVAQNKSINLSWDKSIFDGGSPITGYRIYRDTTPNSKNPVVTISLAANESSHLDNYVIYGQTYYYRIVALNKFGQGQISNEINATTGQPPSEPLNLTTKGYNGYISLTWDSPSSIGDSSISGYNIYRRTDQDDESLLISIGIQLNYTDNSVINGQTYYYKISATNSYGEGQLSHEKYATPGKPPSEPLNLQALGHDGYVELTWNTPSSSGDSMIIGYTIYRGINPDTKYLYTHLGVQLNYIDNSVINGQTYYYKISATNSYGEGQLSHEKYATPSKPPSEPLNLQALGHDGYVELTWNTPSSNGGLPITGYTIFRGSSPDTESPYAQLNIQLNYTDNSVTNGQTYYYKVCAVNSKGNSPMSIEASTTPMNSSKDQGVNKLLFEIFLIIILIILLVIPILPYIKKIFGVSKNRILYIFLYYITIVVPFILFYFSRILN